MEKTRLYPRVRFTPETLREAAVLFQSLAEGKGQPLMLRADFPDESWDHDSEEEFFADVRRGAKSYRYRLVSGSQSQS